MINVISMNIHTMIFKRYLSSELENCLKQVLFINDSKEKYADSFIQVLDKRFLFYNFMESIIVTNG